MDTITQIIEASPITAHQGKYGYYPCSYETFKKLKALKKAYWEAIRQLGAWFRWSRKAPQNQIIRKRTRNAIGQATGWVDVGPWLEPKLSPVFKAESWRRPWKTLPEHMPDFGILEAFEQARMPKPKGETKPLTLSESSIDFLYLRITQ